MPIMSIDFPIDVNMLTGSLVFSGVEQALPTEYPTLVYDFKEPGLDADGDELARFKKITSDYYDFDLDGENDTIVCGALNEDHLFVPIANGLNGCSAFDYQGIYLSSSVNRPYICPDDPLLPLCQPQFVRLIDIEKVDRDIGLVVRMSHLDIQDTDIFVVRKATGQLVSMRQGLKDNERAYPYSGNSINTQVVGTQVDFRMIIRGADAEFSRALSNYSKKSFDQWQQESNMAPEFYSQKNSDHIRSGEALEVWAINRVTGYIGSQEVVVGKDQLDEGYLDSAVNLIEMRPPNLKIWAERKYTIEDGLDAGSEVQYIIGNEGIGEANDAFIKITTAWYSEDGSPIPDVIGAYGYTGRLAYISAENELAESSASGQARFSVTPGTHSEVVRIPNGAEGLNNEHYYIQVNALPAQEFDDFALKANTGEQENRDSDINFDGVAENLYRPERFVPFKTPQFNEELSTLQKQAYLLEFNRREGEGVSTDNMSEPPLVYDWYYRPDYQFSVYDLELNQIQIAQFSETGERKPNSDEFDLLKTGENFISPSSIIDILYQLNEIEQTPLQRFDGEQTLTLALGQTETKVTFTENQHFLFENLNFFSQLGSEDYLTLALYSNEDSANLLYQYAFESEGLLVYYNIPAVSNNETRMKQVDYRGPDPDNGHDHVHDAPVIRTLGGMRLKYAYLPPKIQNAEGQFVEMVPEHFNVTFRGSNGWLCKHQVGYLNEYDQHADCLLTIDGQEIEMMPERKILHSFQNEVPANVWAFWWEPTSDTGVSGSPATEESSSRWENDLEIEFTLNIDYPGNAEETQELFF
ncbi:hypothetical protein [Reinekea sp. G2M2-21]|uniref:hypothetical protein n=1 Tax=Reinekea sp. G2M2-21 TaxID=2788942 RepID=UPI0018A9E34E|nr:hypothetical protein [Reinekea sp. G2M2-21]